MTTHSEKPRAFLDLEERSNIKKKDNSRLWKSVVKKSNEILTLMSSLFYSTREKITNSYIPKNFPKASLFSLKKIVLSLYLPVV